MKAQLSEASRKVEEALEPLLLRYQSFTPVEQLVVMALGGLIVLVLIFILIWMPVYQWKNAQVAEYERLQSLISWVHQQGPKIKGRSDGAGKLPAGQTLQSMITRDSQRAKIVLQRTEPKGQNLRVWINEVSFDVLIKWLLDLRRRYGIEAVDASIEHKSNEKGAVKAVLVFSGA